MNGKGRETGLHQVEVDAGVSEEVVGAGNGSNLCLGRSRRVGKTEVRHRELVGALAVLRPSESPLVADGGETAGSSG